MNDKEAFEEWFKNAWDMDFDGHDFRHTIQVKAWQFACEYKQKEIDDLKLEYDKLTDWASEYVAENAKLKAVVMLASNASCYTEYEDACSCARQVLKELDEIK